MNDTQPVVSPEPAAKPEPAARAPISRGLKIALAVAILFSLLAEGVLTWVLVVHAPWIGWPLTVVSVLALLLALYKRFRRKAQT